MLVPWWADVSDLVNLLLTCMPFKMIFAFITDRLVVYCLIGNMHPSVCDYDVAHGGMPIPVDMTTRAVFPCDIMIGMLGVHVLSL